MNAHGAIGAFLQLWFILLVEALDMLGGVVRVRSLWVLIRVLIVDNCHWLMLNMGVFSMRYWLFSSFIRESCFWASLAVHFIERVLRVLLLVVIDNVWLMWLVISHKRLFRRLWLFFINASFGHWILPEHLLHLCRHLVSWLRISTRILWLKRTFGGIVMQHATALLALLPHFLLQFCDQLRLFLDCLSILLNLRIQYLLLFRMVIFLNLEFLLIFHQLLLLLPRSLYQGLLGIALGHCLTSEVVIMWVHSFVYLRFHVLKLCSTSCWLPHLLLIGLDVIDQLLIMTLLLKELLLHLHLVCMDLLAMPPFHFVHLSSQLLLLKQQPFIFIFEQFLLLLIFLDLILLLDNLGLKRILLQIKLSLQLARLGTNLILQLWHRLILQLLLRLQQRIVLLLVWLELRTQVLDLLVSVFVISCCLVFG